MLFVDYSSIFYGTLSGVAACCSSFHCVFGSYITKLTKYIKKFCSLVTWARHKILKELLKRLQECWAGEKVKAKNKGHKLAVFSIIMGNFCSLIYKMAKLMHWLTPKVVTEPDFMTVLWNRNVTDSSKKKEGGIVLYVTERWCNPGHTCIKDHLCSLNVELLAVELRLYYFQKEFTSISAVNAYIPLSANAEVSADVISKTFFSPAEAASQMSSW